MHARPGASSTTQTEIHKPCGFSFIAVRLDGEVVKDSLYRGEDCVQRFLTALVAKESELREFLKQKAPLQMTEPDWLDFNSAASCHICKKDLIKRNQRDEADVFCPDTGEYFGKAHRHTKAPGSHPASLKSTIKSSRMMASGPKGSPSRMMWRRRMTASASTATSLSYARNSETLSETTATSPASTAARPTTHATGATSASTQRK